MRQGLMTNRELRHSASALLNAKSYAGFFGLFVLLAFIEIIFEWLILNFVVNGIISVTTNAIFMTFGFKLCLDFVRNGKIAPHIGALSLDYDFGLDYVCCCLGDDDYCKLSLPHDIFYYL